MLAGEKVTLGIFASDRGPGDAERASVMSQAGAYLAGKGARLVCLATEETLPVPLISAARASGGEVILISDEGLQLPAALSDVPVERIPHRDRQFERVAALSHVLVALPGSLASATSLFSTWARAGAGEVGRPVIFFNRNRAFEVVRGLATDVLSHGVRHHDRHIQFTDSVEDLWGKVTWLLEQDRT